MPSWITLKVKFSAEVDKNQVQRWNGVDSYDWPKDESPQWEARSLLKGLPDISKKIAWIRVEVPINTSRKVGSD